MIAIAPPGDDDQGVGGRAIAANLSPCQHSREVAQGPERPAAPPSNLGVGGGGTGSTVAADHLSRFPLAIAPPPVPMAELLIFGSLIPAFAVPYLLCHVWGCDDLYRP